MSEITGNELLNNGQEDQCFTHAGKLKCFADNVAEAINEGGGGGGLPYNIYRAKIYNGGTSTVLEDTIGGISFSHTYGDGIYVYSGVFDPSKTIVNATLQDGANYLEITIDTTFIEFGIRRISDDVFTDSFVGGNIEIIVYP